MLQREYDEHGRESGLDGESFWTTAHAIVNGWEAWGEMVQCSHLAGCAATPDGH
jgi:hypothetical protein